MAAVLKTMKSVQEGKRFISNKRQAGRVKRVEREKKEGCWGIITSKM